MCKFANDEELNDLMMRIIDFEKLIKEIPYKYQTFEIKRSIWEDTSQQELVKRVFGNQKTILISRFDLYTSTNNIEEFALKILMWGYPTKGRGKNMDNLLEKTNFKNLLGILKSYHNAEITIDKMVEDLQNLKGVGLSTITKFTHFLDTTINNNKAVILDNQIIKAINTQRYDEFKALEGISYENAVRKYELYIEIIARLSEKMNVKPDQVEMFLFTFGRILSDNSINRANKFQIQTTKGLKVINK